MVSLRKQSGKRCHGSLLQPEMKGSILFRGGRKEKEREREKDGEQKEAEREREGWREMDRRKIERNRNGKIKLSSDTICDSGFSLVQMYFSSQIP